LQARLLGVKDLNKIVAELNQIVGKRRGNSVKKQKIEAM